MADRAIGVWLSIAARARSEGTTVGVRHAVTACGEAIGAGAVLSMSGSDGSHEPVFATDPRSDELEDLQATLGQGPSAEVIDGLGPVLEGELASSQALARWPEFSPAAVARGVAAVFAVPVGVGAARLGVLSLYRDWAGPLSRDQFNALLLYADAVLMLALDERGGLAPGAVDLVGEGFTERRAEVHQAAGMVSVQLGVSLTDALVAMRARAFAEGRTISQVAADVVARRLSFSLPDYSPRGWDAPPGEQADDEHREGGE
ncbi:MAG TPA: ANTAR domain-containing protein [Streptosporangiaceae bacterium]|nr:ANTAR domain-containing protein [Streptosporangiaceae bacterium]